MTSFFDKLISKTKKKEIGFGELEDRVNNYSI